MPDPSHGNMHHNSCKCGQIWDSLYTKEEVELLHILMVRGENVCSLQLKCHAVNSQSPWESVYSIAKLFKTAGQRLVWPTVSAAVTRKCMGSPPCMGRLLITTGVDTINFLVSPLSMSGCYGLPQWFAVSSDTRAHKFSSWSLLKIHFHDIICDLIFHASIPAWRQFECRHMTGPFLLVQKFWFRDCRRL